MHTAVVGVSPPSPCFTFVLKCQTYGQLHHRGRRVGQHFLLRRTSTVTYVNRLNIASVITVNRPPPRTHKLTHGRQQPSSSLLSVPTVVSPTPFLIAVFNAQSVGNKYAAIYDRVATDKPPICAIVETWPNAPVSSTALRRATVASNVPILDQRRKLPKC